MDDGVRVRVSAAVECACVLASVGRPGGAPLVPGAARTRAGLAPGADVVSLPKAVRVAAQRTATGAELNAWSAWIAATPASADAVALLTTLADQVERDGVTPGAARPPSAGDPRQNEELLRGHLRALHARVEKRAREGSAWRGEKDFAQRAVTLMARACEAALADERAPAWAPPDDPARESFYVRASIFGHALVLDDVPLASALRDRAARLVLARAMGGVLAGSAEPVDPAMREPIAVVEAMLRGHGLAAYVHDLER